MKLNFGSIIKLISVNVFILFLFCELILRISKKGTPTYSEYLSLANNGYFEESKNNGFTLIRNYHGIQYNQDRNLKQEPNKIPITTDDNGLRTSLNPISECGFKVKNKILFLGDSYTFGVYLRDMDTYPSRFQLLLNQNQICFEVLNAGYANGHNADQIHSWLYQNIDKYRPKLIIYNIFAGNDLIIDKSNWIEINKNKMPIKWNKKNQFVKNGILRDSNLSSPLKTYHLPFLRESKFLVTLEDELKDFIANFRGEETGFQFSYLSHLFGIRNQSNIDKQEEIFINLINSMKNLSESKGAKFITVYMPANFEVYPKLIAKVLPQETKSDLISSSGDYGFYLCGLIKDKVNVPCLDLTKLMINSNNVSGLTNKKLLKKNTFFPNHGEIHMSKSGANFAAENVFKWIKKDLD